MSEMMVNSNDTASKNVFGRKTSSSGSVTKGAIIGAGIGAGASGAISGFLYKSAKNSIPTEDAFVKQTVKEMSENAKKYGIGVGDADLSRFTETAKGRFKTFQKDAVDELAKIRKSIPKTILKAAGIVGAVGAGIGLIVHLVKKGKAEKQG